MALLKFQAAGHSFAGRGKDWMEGGRLAWPAGENCRPFLGLKSDGIAQFRTADLTFAGRGEDWTEGGRLARPAGWRKFQPGFRFQV